MEDNTIGLDTTSHAAHSPDGSRLRLHLCLLQVILLSAWRLRSEGKKN